MWLFYNLILCLIVIWFAGITSSLTSTIESSHITQAVIQYSTTKNIVLTTNVNKPKITKGSSVNKPNISSCAVWNTTGITIANSSTVNSSNPLNAFIDVNNTLYIVNKINKEIKIWSEKSNTAQLIVYSNFTFSTGLFVTSIGDIFIDDDYHSHVSQWSLQPTKQKIIMYINRGCNSLFVDVSDTLYCTINDGHLVTRWSLDNKNSQLVTAAAGTGCADSTSMTLNQPMGIYVDNNFDLYVADTGNDRIQRFSYGNLSGTTVAGKSVKDNVNLNKPTSIMLDIDDRLYIVDSGNQRIIRLGRYDGYQCLFGCSIPSCLSLSQLCDPLTAMFDIHGNIYVINRKNSGVQKFILATNSCQETTFSSPQTSTTTSSTTTTSFSNDTCAQPTMTLFPGTSSYENPLQFRRSQDFYISVTFKIKCVDSFAIRTTWTIFNCTINCSIPADIDPSIDLTTSELVIPARILTYGIYEMKLTATMTGKFYSISTESAYVKINPTGATANLVLYGTSIITSGQERDLILDPGAHSINPDEKTFNASDWTYSYQCRVYDLKNLSKLTTIDYNSNHPCFSNRKDNMLGWRDRSVDGSLSSIIILRDSLKADHTYQFVVYITNRRNATLQALGYLLVEVEISRPQMVAIACVITSMCSPNQEYQSINPSTQVSLFSECVGVCNSTLNISWYVYEGQNDSTTNIVRWNRFNHLNSSQNLHFFGMNTSDFTTINTLFLKNPHIIYWRFEVIYAFHHETSMSALNFIINQPPQNGSCSITPLNGTISTLFTINCSLWLDDDQIKDYAVYFKDSSEISSEQLMLAFKPIPDFQLQLPAGIGPQSLLNLTVQIRDQLNCATEIQLEPVVVLPDSTVIDTLIDMIENPDKLNTNNPVIEALVSGNQNLVGQVVTSLSQELNKKNKQDFEDAIRNGIDATSISVSPLGSKRSINSDVITNHSSNIDYIQKLNTLSNIRDYLMNVTVVLSVVNIDSIKLLATSLAQLTKSTNELSRTSSLLAARKCHQLAVELHKRARQTSHEDARSAAIQIAHCINNVLTAINAPLQQRGVFLNVNDTGHEIGSEDYEDDFELNQLIFNSIKSDDEASTKIVRTLYYQRKTADEIAQLAVITFSLLTSVLKIHLNIEQQMAFNSSCLLLFLETTTVQSLAGKLIKPVDSASIHYSNKLTN
ncbi:hypothetical protein I4U23_001310 [Adineta vaga]|nr:hypothetical protein I4U23_001310 [Adineta vaga]